MKKVAAAFLALVIGASLAGCSSSATGKALETSTPSASATEENPYGGFPVDPPADTEVVLTVSGTKSIELTMPKLKAMAQVEAKIFEPFVKKTQTFKGVELKTLFAEAGIVPADKLTTVALNDYSYKDTASNFIDSNAILALARDGEIIPMDQGGPIRIIFPDGNPYSDFLDAWNWSLRTIELDK
jgi:hypothetical protein